MVGSNKTIVDVINNLADLGTKQENSRLGWLIDGRRPPRHRLRVNQGFDEYVLMNKEMAKNVSFKEVIRAQAWTSDRCRLASKLYKLLSPWWSEGSGTT